MWSSKAIVFREWLRYNTCMNSDELRMAKKKYWNHYSNSKRRNIPFLLSFDQWINIWLSSGHWHQRGIKRGQYVMSRYNDCGSYSEGNVFIQQSKSNIQQANTGKSYPKLDHTRHLMRLAKLGKPKIICYCLMCRSKISVNNIVKHYNATSCRKKALRRGLLDLY